MDPSSAPTLPSGLHRRLWRTGVFVVGGSVIASASFTHLSLTASDTIIYSDAMAIAVMIPLVVASLAYGWIALLTARLEASRHELERLALSDSLTGLANRRAAMNRLAGWAAAPVTTPITLAIADIDYFKRVNDRLGHDGGDASLVHFAAMLRRIVPDGWLVARIGGEEFMIAAPTNDHAGFAAQIETLRATIAKTPLITPAGPYNLTASFGLAARQGAERIDRLITRADIALYAAKQAGRNRIEQAA